MDSHRQIVRHWNNVAEGWTTRRGYSNTVLARHKRAVYLQLLDSWVGTKPVLALKTDLFAEALNDEEFVSALPWGESIIGIDISQAIVARARERLTSGGAGPKGWVTCDVRSLPFASSTFDCVLSDSTLDHLATTAEIEAALSEISRVLIPGGTMVLTIDNPHNLTYPPRWLMRLWLRLGLSPYFIGTTLTRQQLRAILPRIGFRFEEETTILHYPHPDRLVRAAEAAVRAIGRGSLDSWIQRMFERLERLQHSKVRYFTGRYLAVRTTKVGAA